MNSFLRRFRPDGPGRYHVTVRHEHGTTIHGALGTYQLVVDAPTARSAAEAAEHSAEVAQGGIFRAVSVRRASAGATVDLEL